MFPRQAIYRLLRDAGAYKFCTGGYRRALLAKYVFTWSLFSSQSKALTDIGRCDVLDSLKNSSQKIFKTALKSTFRRVRHSVKSQFQNLNSLVLLPSLRGKDTKL